MCLYDRRAATRARPAYSIRVICARPVVAPVVAVCWLDSVVPRVCLFSPPVPVEKCNHLWITSSSCNRDRLFGRPDEVSRASTIREPGWSIGVFQIIFTYGDRHESQRERGTNLVISRWLTLTRASGFCAPPLWIRIIMRLLQRPLCASRKYSNNSVTFSKYLINNNDNGRHV